MSWIVLFFVAQDIPAVELPVSFTTSETLANLFYLNPGFLDPSRSEGIVGADLNPGVMGFSKTNIDLYVAGSGSADADAGLSFDVPLNGGDTVLATVPVDLDATFTDQGGFDYFGLAGKMGVFSLGFIYQRPSSMKVSIPDGYEFATTLESDSLTSFDYGYEYAPGDTLPLALTLSGSISATLHPSADAEISQAPIFFGGAVKLGPLGLGIGYRYRKYVAEFHAGGRIALDSGDISCNPSSPGWNTDSLDVTLQAPADDSLFYASFDGLVQGSQNAVVAGLLLRPVKFLGLSLGVEAGMRSTVTTTYTRTIYLPDTVTGNLNIIDDNVTVDPGNQSASGSLVLGGGTIVKSVDYLEDAVDYNLLQYVAVRGGVNLFIINLGGGLELAENADGVYMGTNYITPSLGIPLPKSELRLGSVISWRYAKAGSFVVPTVPLIYAGVGLTVKPDAMLGGVVLQEIGIGLKASMLSYAVSMLSSGLAGGDVNLGSYLPNLALSGGIRLGFKLPEKKEAEIF